MEIRESLSEYYNSLGYTSDQWNIGPEHPTLEAHALTLLATSPTARILEIGYQSGGFAVPVILAMRDRPDFAYTGIDSGEYANAVDGSIIAEFLSGFELRCPASFHTGDAGQFLKNIATQQFDLILVDHYKPLYAREFYTIAKRNLLSPTGYILFHDVLDRAEGAWKECRLICEVFGFSWKIVEHIPGGLAVVSGQTQSESRSISIRFSQIKIEILILFCRAKQELRVLRKRIRSLGWAKRRNS